jgi:hypothetical protein
METVLVASFLCIAGDQRLIASHESLIGRPFNASDDSVLLPSLLFRGTAAAMVAAVTVPSPIDHA